MTALRDMTADELRARMARIVELNPHGFERQQAYRNTAARLRRLEAAAELELERERLELGARYRDGAWLVEVVAVDAEPDAETGGTVTVRVLEAPARHRATLGAVQRHRQRGHRSAFLPRYKREPAA